MILQGFHQIGRLWNTNYLSAAGIRGWLIVVMDGEIENVIKRSAYHSRGTGTYIPMMLFRFT